MGECPFCKAKVGPNDLLTSEEATCPACGNRLLSSPEPGPLTKATAVAEQNGVGVKHSTSPEPTVSPVSPRRAAPASSRVPSPGASEEEEDEPSSLLDRLRDIDFGSALALLCFSVSLLFCSFSPLETLVKPTAALGLLAGLAGGALLARQRTGKAVLPFLMSLPCLLVLLFAGRWPGSPSSPPRLVAVPLKQDGMAAHQDASDEDWLDASNNAAKRGDVRVEIGSVRVGPVDLKQDGAVTSTAEPYLTIFLRCTFQSVIFEHRPYEPWSDRGEVMSSNAAVLTDDQGRTYEQKTFDSGNKVVGRADKDALTPGHQVKDVLVYPVPDNDVKYLRLMLPSSAFGLPGEFRFQIPRSMIGGL